MKNRFNTLDTTAIVVELQQIKGFRVNQVYDIDKKTYLIKLAVKDSNKVKLLIESGIRVHTTQHDWPKNPAPSGFTMKLRKHIRNKRITAIEQIGRDRIIHIKFGSDEVAYHLFVELFNKGNVVLTDYEFTIISLLRSYSDGENNCLALFSKYPLDRVRSIRTVTFDDLQKLIKMCKKNEQIKKCLLPIVDLGQGYLEHCLLSVGINPELKVNSPNVIDELHEKLIKLLDEISSSNLLIKKLEDSKPKGYIFCIKKIYENGQDFCQMIEFNPYPFLQGSDYEVISFETFTDAIDEYFSKLESQKIQLSIVEKEEEAMKKVNKIRIDQESRLKELTDNQLTDKVKGDLIINNASLVDEVINIIRCYISKQMSWGMIKNIIEEAKQRNDPIASLITQTKFDINHVSLLLRDPFNEECEATVPTEIDIDLSLSAHANATKYYDLKKHAAIKADKTINAMKKALKLAEVRAQESVKIIKTQATITVTQKVYWFEKFYWFISSDNYLVIGGRDKKQNEIIVKRYMKPGDLYIHADLIGASSVVVKNPSGEPVPPRTLDEAGIMAICYSNAWETKIICRAWWVYDHQVSKTAPSGEYLVTGGFMIRGQKNFLLPIHLQLGFSFLFKLSDSSACRHQNERKPKLSLCESPSTESVKIGEMQRSLDYYQGDPEIKSVEMDNFNEQQTDNIKRDLHHPKPKRLNLSSVDLHKIEESKSDLNEENTGNKTEVNEITNNAHPKDQLKRGQRSKLKKIKEKYKDQDEEERQLKMMILQSAGQPNPMGKSKSKIMKQQKKIDQKRSDNSKAINIKKPIAISSGDIETENVPEVEINTDVDMLSLFTGQPLPEDELLYAVPVVAPYNAVLNNKFKIKMIPGMTKRGKAAHVILEQFLKSKECTSNEKHLLKCVSDQVLSRNLPGKVKIVCAHSKKK